MASMTLTEANNFAARQGWKLNNELANEIVQGIAAAHSIRFDVAEALLLAVADTVRSRMLRSASAEDTAYQNAPDYLDRVPYGC